MKECSSNKVLILKSLRMIPFIYPAQKIDQVDSKNKDLG